MLSRTDSIGDVVLTLPMAGMIRKYFPKARIVFLGREYTREIIALSEHVDQFVSYDELEKLDLQKQVEKIRALKLDVFLHVFPEKKIAALAKKSGVELRVGTTNRIYHWWTCNKLLKLSRKNSPFHEAQLNLKLLNFLDIDTEMQIGKMHELYGFTKVPALESEYARLQDSSRFQLILHPKSKGSAREWGLVNFRKLIDLLPSEKFRIYISGTREDSVLMRDFLDGLKNKDNVVDITGKMSLKQFIAFISHCDGLIAASTGPLHIAAALGKRALGLFSSRRPIHPGRWAPLGPKAAAIVEDPSCPVCASGKDCDCITRIPQEKVIELLIK